jgi:hypothetical protein
MVAMIQRQDASGPLLLYAAERLYLFGARPQGIPEFRNRFRCHSRSVAELARIIHEEWSGV